MVIKVGHLVVGLILGLVIWAMVFGIRCGLAHDARVTREKTIQDEHDAQVAVLMAKQASLRHAIEVRALHAYVVIVSFINQDGDYTLFVTCHQCDVHEFPGGVDAAGVKWWGAYTSDQIPWVE